jgi:4a-hydroxytetrahydrobiopterin dehydratase
MSDKPKVYSEAEIAPHLQKMGLGSWKLEDGWLRRKYNTDGWRSTLMLVNAIGFMAEGADHHPDLAVTWAKVWVKLQTHSAGGITDKDFALAKMIEEHVLWRPEAGSPFQGQAANEFVKVEK